MFSRVWIDGAIDKLAPPAFHTSEHKAKQHPESGAHAKTHKGLVFIGQRAQIKAFPALLVFRNGAS